MLYNARPLRTTSCALNPNAERFIPYISSACETPSSIIILEPELEYDPGLSLELYRNATPVYPPGNILTKKIMREKDIPLSPWHGAQFLYLSVSLFCIVVSICLFKVLFPAQQARNMYGICALHTLKDIRLKNPKKVTVGHLNINSIPNKFDGIMDIVKHNLDIFVISETKIDESFPNVQFFCEGYSLPHRRDRCLGGGGLLMYVNQDIPSRILISYIIPDDIEILCVEINLRKQKWAVFGIYRPPGMKESYFIDHISRLIDSYSKKYENVIIMGDFNMQECDEHMKGMLVSYNLINIVKENTCFKGPPKCYDFILTNRKYHFQNTVAMTTGFSDFHKMTVTVLKSKSDPLQIKYRDYKNYNPANFREELSYKLLANENSSTDFREFQCILCEVVEIHAPMKIKKVRANNSPFMTKSLRKMIMNRSRCKNVYFKTKTVENLENYRKLGNACTKLTRKAKKEYFQNLHMNDITDNRTFWRGRRYNELKLSIPMAEIISTVMTCNRGTNYHTSL